MVKLKAQLAKEDLAQERAGVLFPHKMSPAEFLQCALKVEADQCVCFFLYMITTANI